MPAASVRDEAQKIVDQMTDDATWDDLLYEIYVRQSVEAGLEDIRAGRLLTTDEVRQKLGLPS